MLYILTVRAIFITPDAGLASGLVFGQKPTPRSGFSSTGDWLSKGSTKCAFL